MLTAVGLVVIADVGNAEAFIVRHNASRAREGAAIDDAYLRTLSDDAVPALDLAFLRTSPRRAPDRVLDCARHPTGVTTWNTDVQAADRIRRRACDQHSG